MRRGLSWPLRSLLAIALAGCITPKRDAGKSQGTSQRHKTTTTIEKPDETKLPTSTEPSRDDPLAQLYIEPPGRFEQADDDAYDTGISDLDKAVRDSGGDDEDPDDPERKALIDDGFVRGSQRAFETSSYELIIVSITEFDTPAGAKHYGARILASAFDTDLNDEPYDITTVEGVPGSHVRVGTDATADSLFVYDNLLIGISVEESDDNDSLILALSKQQFDHIVAS